jgi:Tetratricopeptide repeat
MTRGAWYLCLWPGLARLWLRGEWASLLLATGFSLLLNAAILATFVWPEWLGPGFATAIWPVLGLVWLTSLWGSWRQRNELFGTSAEAVAETAGKDLVAYDRLFIEAQGEYLRGDWDHARTLLERQLGRFPRDAASRLLLASLLRRSGRLDQAEEQLIVLGKLDQAAPWLQEISSEQRLIERDRLAGQAPPDGEVAQDLRPELQSPAVNRAA